MYQTTWAEIDRSSLLSNIRSLRSRVQPNVALCGVVKADGYGHGSIEVAQTMEKEGISFFGVANLREGLELRRGGIQGEILVFGWTPPEGFAAALLEGISLTMFSVLDLEALNEEAKKQNKKAKIHLKVDTGMNRLGARWDGEILELARQASSFSEIQIKGTFSHLYNANERDDQSVKNQVEKFSHALALLDQAGIKVGIRHLANSAGTLFYPDTHFEMVRPGEAYYGLSDYPDVIQEPVMTLKTRVAFVKNLPIGETVGYGGNFQKDQVCLIGSLPVGYADGWTWAMKGYVIPFQGRKLPIAGNVCMDQMMIDLTEWKECKAGDELVLFGKNGAKASEIAEYGKIATLEVATRIGKRVPRIYK